MSSESKIQAEIRLKLSELRSGVFLRYQVGTFLTMDARPVKIGQVGVSDLIGVTPHVVTAEDVGKTIGVFVAIETKRPKGGTTSKEQGNFLRLVNSLGGIAGIARSVDDAVSMITGKWKSEPVKKHTP